jgi:hypothetical protein
MGKVISGILTGVSGEYFVAAELSRRGFISSVTLKNTKGIDILVTNDVASKFIGIQVKTNYGDRKSWLLNEKAENFHAENLFYVFVNLIGVEQLPEYYIVPSVVVSEHIRKGHEKWLATPGKKGQPHIDSPMRRFSDESMKYLNNWDILQL